MAVLWGIHNNEKSIDLVGGGFVSIGWEELGDLTKLDFEPDALKLKLAETYPTAKPGAIPVWGGLLRRFVEEVQVGDYVISPRKADRTLSFGVIDSPYYFAADAAELQPNRRKVKWIKTGVSRDEFSQSALNEIGSSLTLFRIKTNANEFLHYFSVSDGVTHAAQPGSEVELAEEEPSAERVDTYSRDFVADVLRHMDPYRFEHFVAAVLRAMGYRASATVASGDGGVDVIASRDALAIEPPIIKVQCKRTSSTIGAPDVQRLAGALAHGGSELGLFVTLGTYSADAVHLERTRQDLRLVNGKQLIDLVLEHYEEIDAEWKRLIPLRRVYAVDRDTSE